MEDPEREVEPSWPAGVRGLISVALLLHISAILAGALAAPPSSSLEQSLAQMFAPYHQLIDQGYAYRYYAPEPGPTPVVTAELRPADASADSRPMRTVR